MREFDQDLAVDAARVDNINRLADKLMSQGHAGSAVIYQRQQALNERWDRLQDRASERRQRLAEASEIHAFNRDCNDVSVMINEKVGWGGEGRVLVLHCACSVLLSLFWSKIKQTDPLCV